jgi:sec-independent protein translocase protein TatA
MTAANMIFGFLNLGGQEIFLIVLVVLIFFGAKKIPELARGLGKGIREFKDATKDVRDEIENASSGVNNTVDDVKRTVNK